MEMLTRHFYSQNGYTAGVYLRCIFNFVLFTCVHSSIIFLSRNHTNVLERSVERRGI